MQELTHKFACLFNPLEELSAFRELTDAGVAEFAKAFRRGTDEAYRAVMKPTEGTMLTVARVASEEASASGIAAIMK